MRKWERGEAENKRGQTKAEKNSPRKEKLVSFCLFACLFKRGGIGAKDNSLLY